MADIFFPPHSHTLLKHSQADFDTNSSETVRKSRKCGMTSSSPILILATQTLDSLESLIGGCFPGPYSVNEGKRNCKTIFGRPGGRHAQPSIFFPPPPPEELRSSIFSRRRVRPAAERAGAKADAPTTTTTTRMRRRERVGRTPFTLSLIRRRA